MTLFYQDPGRRSNNSNLELLSEFGGELGNVVKDFANYKEHEEWWRSAASIIQQQIPEFRDFSLEQIREVIIHNLDKLEKKFGKK